MKFILWLSLFIIFYAYFGYVVVLVLMDAWQRLAKTGRTARTSTGMHHETTAHDLPSVSFIITAYNEEQRISQKIENTLSLVFPTEKLEIIIASDCSSDGTNKIVRSHADKGVQLIRSLERRGKEHAQMHAVRAATGEILIFSDVATVLQPDAIQQIVSNFSDPSVGCVSSEDRFVDQEGSVSGEGLYVRYEMLLRALESRVNTLVGMSGSFFAARREVCQNWAPDLQSDFNTLLNTVKIGMKGISDPNSIGYYENIADERKEFQRKVRTVLRGITVLMRNWQLLNPFRHGLFAWQLVSHKVCRWTVPLFLGLALVSNAILLGAGAFYATLFVVQLGLYVSAVWYMLKGNTTKRAKNLNAKPKTWAMLKTHIRPLVVQVARIAYYFSSVNIAIAWAWLKYFKGERATLWEPSKR